MVVTLRVLAGTELAEEIAVTAPRFTIGRAEDCDLRPNCPLVSRHHCELVVQGSMVSIRDVHSKNGTYVNGQRVDGQRELHSGDQLGVGLRRLAVVIDQEAGTPSASEDRALVSSQRPDRDEIAEDLVECLPWTPA